MGEHGCVCVPAPMPKWGMTSEAVKNVSALRPVICVGVGYSEAVSCDFGCWLPQATVPVRGVPVSSGVDRGDVS